jgi:hypothetical protein
MALATDILVILLLILIACRPKTRLLLSAIPGVRWLLTVAFFGLSSFRKSGKAEPPFSR